MKISMPNICLMPALPIALALGAMSVALPIPDPVRVAVMAHAGNATADRRPVRVCIPSLQEGVWRLGIAPRDAAGLQGKRERVPVIPGRCLLPRRA
jgi:hypothetical protein